MFATEKKFKGYERIEYVGESLFVGKADRGRKYSPKPVFPLYFYGVLGIFT